jgi:hypothetical protein
MNFDRSLLALFVVTMAATVVKAPYPICECLGLLCGLQTLRSHAKALNNASAASAASASSIA